MAFSRRTRFEEKLLQKRFLILISASVGIVFLVVIFGLQALVSFSLAIDKLRGTNQTTVAEEKPYLPTPQLHPIYEATFSGQISVSGKSIPFGIVQLFVNKTESERTKSASDGAFLFQSVSLDKGENSITARLVDENNNESADSYPLSVFVTDEKPKLEITSPENGARQTGDKNNIMRITGKTDASHRVTINDRIVIVQSDGSFAYDYLLPEGDTKLFIVAMNAAGIKNEIVREVRYEK